MKKVFGQKFVFAFLLCIFMFVIAGCRDSGYGFESVSENTENTETNAIQLSSFGTNNLIGIGNGLYYDRTTNIVYWWNGALTSTVPGNIHFMRDFATSPSVYYASNGLPYKYNPETGELEEISTGCDSSCCQ